MLLLSLLPRWLLQQVRHNSPPTLSCFSATRGSRARPSLSCASRSSATSSSSALLLSSSICNSRASPPAHGSESSCNCTFLEFQQIGLLNQSAAWHVLRGPRPNWLLTRHWSAAWVCSHLRLLHDVHDWLTAADRIWLPSTCLFKIWNPPAAHPAGH